MKMLWYFFCVFFPIQTITITQNYYSCLQNFRIKLILIQTNTRGEIKDFSMSKNRYVGSPVIVFLT